MQHLWIVLILREQRLYANRSKCCFGSLQVQYLGHVLYKGTISMDTAKVDCITSWPIPSSVKELHSFLGLTGYYRRFIRNYRVIAQPLTCLLKKDCWGWNDQATEAFQALKQAMSSTPVLVLPSFQLEFTVDTDASGFGVGAVLQQQGRPIAFFSKALGVRHQALSIYEKEMLAVLLAMRKWHAYLVGRHFKIRIDHQSLRFLFYQVAVTPFQQRWVAKMLGYDFEVTYRKGINNKVADALSRQPQLAQGQYYQLTTSSVISDLLVQVQQSYTQDDRLQKIIRHTQQHQNSDQKYSWDERFLFRKGKIVVGRVQTGVIPSLSC